MNESNSDLSRTLKAISDKMTALIELVATLAKDRFSSQKEAIAFFSELGMTNAEVARVLSTTSGNVAVRRSEQRKRP